MKRFILLFMVSICSCAHNKNLHSEKKVEIFDKKVYNNYTILYGKDDMDTLTFVCSNQLIKDCNWSCRKIDRNGLTHISDIVTSSGDSLIFTYITKDVSKNFKVTVGSGKPGQSTKTYINTYSKKPYLVKNCESLKDY